MIDLRGVWPEWEPVEKIGEGSYGTVYKCKKIENGEEIFSAVKVITVPKNESEYEGLRIDGFTNEASKQYFADIIESFSSEIKLLEELKDQPNIVRIEDSKIIEYDDTIRWDIYIRMELLTGFRDYSEEHAMTQNDVIRLGADICSALEACEKKKIIHRDIKPENIFVDKDGNFKLGDFGVARQLEKTNTTMSQKGTYNYMAPEVVFKKKYDKRADVYSLGMVMYKLLNNNREPFVDPDKQMIRYKDRVEAMDRRLKNERLPAPKNADENLAQIILKACEFNKEKRISSAQEFKKLLLSLDSGKKVRIKKKVSKKVGLAVACVAAVAVILTSLNYIIPMILSPDDPPTDETSPEVYYGEITDSGICGQDVNYAFYQESGTLVLSGSGETFNYNGSDSGDLSQSYYIPWSDYSQKIHTVKVEKGITKIGNNLFNGCLSLNDVDLPETLTEIGDGAFMDCSGLIEFHIPDSVTDIGVNAFYQCIHLESINIPQNILSVGAGAFDEIGFTGENSGWLYYIDNVLIKCTLDWDVIYDDSATTFKIKEGTRVIADNAFTTSNFNQMKEITLPDSVVSIGKSAFEECRYLEKINFPISLTNIGENAFLNCESLKSVKFLPSIEHIGRDAFLNCTSLESIELPDKVIDIQTDAFSVTAYSENQSNWSGNCLYIGKHLVDVNSEGTGEIRIKDGTLSVAMMDSLSYGEFTKLYIPSSVKKLNCIKTCFESIEVSEENNYFLSIDGVLLDKQKTKLIAFPAKMNVSSYKVPDSVREIGENAFYGCKFLQSIDLPNGLEMIGDSAFYGSGLTSINIPKKVNVLSESVFSDCEQLSSVKIPDSVCQIKEFAFNSCTSLEKIDLPNKIKYIASSLFAWSGLKKISIPSSVRLLSPAAFESCDYLTEVNLADGIVWIGSECFFDCGSLKKIHLPDSVEVIDDKVFKDCVSLKQIDWSESLKYIGNEAFRDCDSLIDIVLPEFLEKINGYAFYDCDSLKSVTVPERVSFLGECSIGFSEHNFENKKKMIFTLNCRADSAAYDYAVQNDINYSIID